MTNFVRESCLLYLIPTIGACSPMRLSSMGEASISSRLDCSQPLYSSQVSGFCICTNIQVPTFFDSYNLFNASVLSIIPGFNSITVSPLHHTELRGFSRILFSLRTSYITLDTESRMSFWIEQPIGRVDENSLINQFPALLF